MAQCDSSYFSITTTANQQTISGITVSLSSPTNAQSRRLLNGLVDGYFIGDGNSSEEIYFSFSQPITKIKIIGRALSAANSKIEYFALNINGQYHAIQPNELITPDPVHGQKCFLQPNGSVMGDTLRNGDGSFVLAYENPNGITSMRILDSVTSLDPNGAIFDVEIYAKCHVDTGVVPVAPIFYMPTAFTPNKDGVNDYLKPTIIGNLKVFEFQVFDRWGQPVFSSADIHNGWDGTFLGQNQSTGIFSWICHYQGDGQALQVRKGTVLLIR